MALKPVKSLRPARHKSGRQTADEPGLGGALSAWWLHAESPERLAELTRLVLPFGTLRDTLRADTDAARDALERVGE